MVQWKNFASVTCIQSLYFGEKLSSAIIHLFALSFQTEYCSQIFVSVYYVAFGFVRSLTLPFLSFFFPVVVKSWSSKNQNFNTWGQETVERQVLLGWCDWGLKGWHFYILCTTFIFRCVNKKKAYGNPHTDVSLLSLQHVNSLVFTFPNSTVQF